MNRENKTMEIAMKTGPKKHAGMFKVYRPGEQTASGLSHKVPVGKEFGMLTVIGLPFVVSLDGKQQHLHVVCECKCGETISTPANFLTNNRQTSCGCNKGKHPNAARWTHHGRRLPIYSIWNSMRQRCNNPNQRHFRLYGGRGIKVCDAWNEFSNFKDWAESTGYVAGLTIDRINHDVGYQPDNCQWLTRKEHGKKTWADMAADTATLHAEIASLKQQLAEFQEHKHESNECVS